MKVEHMRRVEHKRLLIEKKKIDYLLSGTGYKLYGWNAIDSFSAIDEQSGAVDQFTPGHVRILGLLQNAREKIKAFEN